VWLKMNVPCQDISSDRKVESSAFSLNMRAGMGIDISPKPVRHGQTPRLREGCALPESDPL
jgi:hypothetical protein